MVLHIEINNKNFKHKEFFMNYIIDKYSGFEKKEIQSGYRCKTFLLNNNKEKYIYQVYIEDNKFQAKKKFDITNLIKSNVNIPEIPNIIDFGENNNFAYLVSEYKEGIEFDKAKKSNIDYHNFYKSLANILNRIHSIDVGDKFRLDWQKRIRRKRIFLGIYRE